MSARSAYRDVLGISGARALIGASGASQLGDWLYNAALLGYIYEATGSAAWVGAATVCRLLPFVLLGPLGGVVADRYPRRTVLLVGDLVRCATMVVLAVVVATDGPIWLVILLTALASAAGTAERPAAMALLPGLVGEMRLGAANALLHTVQDLGIVLGPALGALLLVLGPAEGAFLANALTFAVSAALISSLARKEKGTHRGSSSSRGALAELRHGLRTAASVPFVIPLVVVVAMVELTYGAQTVQLVLYAERHLGLGSEGYGYLLAAAGLGGVLSAAVNHRLAISAKVSWIVVGAGLLACATELAYAGSDLLVLALLVAALSGMGMVSCEVVAETALARVLPHEVIGRVIGAYEAVAVAAMVAGALVAPVLVDATSLRTSLVVLGGVSVLVTAACLGALRGLDVLSLRRAQALEQHVALLAALPLTEGMSRPSLEQLAAAATECPLPPGVDVVAEGAPAHAFYLVKDGEVIVHRRGEELARLGPGRAFGERGLLDEAPRNASVTTAEPTTVLRFEGDVLLDALQGASSLLSAREPTGAGRGDAASSALVDDAAWAGPIEVEGSTVVLVSAGYPGKRRAHIRMAELGARLVILDEPGHWSRALVDDGIAAQWLPVAITGDPDADAAEVLRVLADAGVQADAVLTFWEDSVTTVARVAAALGLPGNPPHGVDAARSKVRTRELSHELGLPSPAARRVRSLDELFAAAMEIGFPAVVKPEFGASAVGCVRVDSTTELPDIYAIVREVVDPEADVIFRAGNDLLLEEYLDGVEFDVDLVMQHGRCEFSSVSQNWPTREPSFQETGLHCPADHDRKQVQRLVDLCIETATAFGLGTGVLHIEGKCTSRGPRIVEVNARMGGGRIWEVVRSVWGVDLVEAHLRAALGLPVAIEASRKPLAGVVDIMLNASAAGRLASLPVDPGATPEWMTADLSSEVGDEVKGPESVFATVLGEITVTGRDLKHARALAQPILDHPPAIEPVAVASLR